MCINDTTHTIEIDLEESPKHPDTKLYRASYNKFKNNAELALDCEHIKTVKYHNPKNFTTK